jgi:hypothetical protein
MRELMAKEIRMTYVARKATKHKLVLRVHKNLFRFVIGNIFSKLLYVVCKKFVCSLFPFYRCHQILLEREKLPVSTELKIGYQIGLLFTSSADEDGGVVKRKKNGYETSRSR